ncbi:MAG: signal recognition particle protein [Gemmatimonadetes bacterium]|nr:signal recognition particle protein [Gemmatimonadota bacterium]MBT5144186.1 signal recognition particle protein [Gemmatimonadota bacterium]MBT5964494.1 signal recognition particle protein [Gemmatimonadota bacterium]MBT6625979.1 signal recognition particle protein [Gemmatimonadota bacterium]MBT7457596.1 signal recognition particle protein [Gemmatimonadota bacterium]
MFDRLTDRLDSVFRQLRGQGKITEKALDESLREIRRALLEADVNFKVAKAFLARVREAAVGQQVMKSLTPGQQVIKIVHSELVQLLGATAEPVRLSPHPPTVILLVGLQGSGKTTMAAKLALHFKSQGRLPFLVAADTYRPAAVDQLRTLGADIGVPVYGPEDAGSTNPVDICRDGLEKGRVTNRSLVLLDTAGRLSIDEEMMAELTQIKQHAAPHETLFIADAMLGQDAVETASRFHEQLPFDGIVLTKMDGDARGGAALSVREVTGAPIKFIGTGEKVDALEAFHPERIASRILGMGDVMSLVEKAEAAFDKEQAQSMEEKLRKQRFTFDDFRSQLQAVRRMGPLDQILGMIPGAGKALAGQQVDESALGQVEAIISSMTSDERTRPQILNGSRRRRIAKGSGTSVQDVNRLVKQFGAMQKMMKQMSKPSRRGRGGPKMPSLPVSG